MCSQIAVWVPGAGDINKPYLLVLTIPGQFRMEEDFELEQSPLGQKIRVGGKTVEVQIYRGWGSDWNLEIVDEFNNSTVWNYEFASDVDALNEAKATIKNEGIESLIGMPPRR